MLGTEVHGWQRPSYSVCSNGGLAKGPASQQRCWGHSGRSQDPNVRDPRNGSVLDMMRVDGSADGSADGNTQERDGAGGGGRVKSRGGGYRVKGE